METVTPNSGYKKNNVSMQIVRLTTFERARPVRFTSSIVSAEQLASRPPGCPKYKPLTIKANTLTHMTAGILAGSQFVKMLNFPFNAMTSRDVFHTHCCTDSLKFFVFVFVLGLWEEAEALEENLKMWDN